MAGLKACRHCKALVAKEASVCPQCGGPNPGKGCFIATAAYGTPLAPEINILRKWRDESLEKTKLGRTFIEVYYNISPPIATLISESEYLKRNTRIFLKPVVNLFKRRMNNN